MIALEADFVEALSVAVGTGCEQLLCRRHACFTDRGRVSARLPTYFLRQESRQRAGPLLPTTLRLRLRATCAVNLLGLCGKTRCVLAHFAQTGCRQSDDGASALCGAEARSKNRASQAQTNMGGVPNSRERDSFFSNLIAARASRYWAKGQFFINLAGRPFPPFWLRLRHVIQAAGIGTEECQCIVLKLAAACLSGARSAERVGRHRSLDCVTQVCP